jgi:pantetheine-phosphate adenylyltransferase
MNIIEQASKLFDEVVVAVLQNPGKGNGLFSIEERFTIIEKLYERMENVKVVTGNGAAVDVAMLHECKAIIRGLRGLSDYDYEVQLAHINKDISNGEVNTVCLFADSEYQFVSSSVVREVWKLDKDVSKYVDPIVEEQLVLKKKQ